MDGGGDGIYFTSDQRQNITTIPDSKQTQTNKSKHNSQRITAYALRTIQWKPQEIAFVQNTVVETQLLSFTVSTKLLTR